MSSEHDGVICTECDEWFFVVFNRNGWNSLCFCPLCGHEFTLDELGMMFNNGDDDGDV